MQRIGLISDTHGLLRPEALAFLRGCDHIVHAGDIGSEDVLTQLAALAPATAVRGNNDTAAWASALPETRLVRLGKMLIYVLHDIAELDIDPEAAGVHAVISGHSHKPAVESRGGVVYVNPGSAGPRRFRLPVSIGELTIESCSVTARTLDLLNPPDELPT